MSRMRTDARASPPPAQGRAGLRRGALQSRKYTDREGAERTAVEVVAGDLVLLGSRRGEAEPEPGSPGPGDPF